jgi:CheY-like chemotaxis protein
MKPLVLVLDDQIMYGRSLLRALRNEYEIVLATSVSEADTLMAGQIDAVLADVRLNEMNAKDRQGLEFVTKARRQYPALLIIAMSALDDPYLEQAALTAGATRFLRKPIVISQLRELLQELLEKGH